MMAVHQTTPRRWTETERKLVCEVAERQEHRVVDELPSGLPKVPEESLGRRRVGHILA